jgi:selT/selW/selH-like putative selenoprotein
MHVAIKYGVRGNYLPRAAGLGAALSRELGVDAELVRGERGVFDVLVDGRVIFSKHSAGRFPTDAEIVQAIREKG